MVATTTELVARVDMTSKIPRVVTLLLGSAAVTCASAAARRGQDGGALDPVGIAAAEPAAFSTVSEGTVTGYTNVISVDGAARVTVAVRSKTTLTDSKRECQVEWVAPLGSTLADEPFFATVSTLRIPLTNGKNDIVSAQVVFPRLRLVCPTQTPLDYAVYAIR